MTEPSAARCRSASARFVCATSRAPAAPAEQADRPARIAQGLLSYCRPSPATRTRLDLRQPLAKSLAMVEQHARKAGVTVQKELPEAFPAIPANAGDREQVFLNLFLNAPAEAAGFQSFKGPELEHGCRSDGGDYAGQEQGSFHGTLRLGLGNAASLGGRALSGKCVCSSIISVGRKFTWRERLSAKSQGPIA